MTIALALDTNVVISGTGGSVAHYVIGSLAMAGPVRVTLAGAPPGDADLYLRVGTAVVIPGYIYDTVSWLAGNNESAMAWLPAGMQLFVAVEANVAFANVTLRAEFAHDAGSLAVPPAAASVSGSYMSVAPFPDTAAAVFGPAGWVMTVSESDSYSSHILKSADGVSWTAHAVMPLDIPANVRNLSWHTDRLAVSESTYVLVTRIYHPNFVSTVYVGRSTDGVNWTFAVLTGTGLTNEQLLNGSGLTFGGGVFCMTVDGGKQAVRSGDQGITWTRHTIGTFSGFGGSRKLVWCSGVFVSNTGINGEYGVYTSPTGATWTFTAPPVVTPRAPIYSTSDFATDGTSLFVVNYNVAFLGTSVATLAAIPAPPNSFQPHFNGRRFATYIQENVSGGALGYEWTGTVWEAVISPLYQLGGSYGGKFTIGGTGALLRASRNPSATGSGAVTDQITVVHRSISGTAWERTAVAGHIITQSRLAYSPTQGTLLVSGNNSSTATLRLLSGESHTFAFTNNNNVPGVLPNGAFVTVTQWPHSVIDLQVRRGEYISGASGGTAWACSPTRYINVSYGSNRVWYTDDGAAWFESAIDAVRDWRSAIWFKGHFYVTAYDGNVSRSADGIAWAPHSVLPGSDSATLFANENFMGAYPSSNGKPVYYFEGGTWKTALNSKAAGLVSSQTSYIVAGHGLFVGIADFYQPATAVIVSLDGRGWRKVEMPAGRWVGVAATNTGFVFAASDNADLYYAKVQAGSFWTGFINCEATA